MKQVGIYVSRQGLKMLNYFLLPAFLVLSATFCVLPIHAELAWEKPKQEVYPQADQLSITAHFAFIVKGASPITITGIKTSCGCTTATIARRTYLPGESGSIDVTYNIGDAMGIQTKIVAITTNESVKQPYTLFLYAHLPEPIKFSSRYLLWNLGAPCTPQFIKINAPAAKPVKVLSVASNSVDISASLQMLQEGRAYTIVVIPTTTKEEARGALTIETNLPHDGGNRTFYAYADVRNSIAVPAITSLGLPHK